MVSKQRVAGGRRYPSLYPKTKKHIKSRTPHTPWLFSLARSLATKRLLFSLAVSFPPPCSLAAVFEALHPRSRTPNALTPSARQPRPDRKKKRFRHAKPKYRPRRGKKRLDTGSTSGQKKSRYSIVRSFVRSLRRVASPTESLRSHQPRLATNSSITAAHLLEFGVSAFVAYT